MPHQTPHFRTRTPWGAMALPPLVALDLTLEDVLADLDPGFLPGVDPWELPSSGRSTHRSDARGGKGA